MQYSRSFILTSGIIAGAVLLYLIIFDGFLIASLASNTTLDDAIGEQNRFLGNPAAFIAHAISCIAGVFNAIALIYHMGMNERIQGGWIRLLWLLTIVIGYGQIAYWWIHVRNDRMSIVANTPSG